MVLPENALQSAMILDFRPRLGNRCMVFPDLTLGLQRFSASDSVFFVAAEKNGFACSGRSGYEVRV